MASFAAIPGDQYYSSAGGMGQGTMDGGQAPQPQRGGGIGIYGSAGAGGQATMGGPQFYSSAGNMSGGQTGDDPYAYTGGSLLTPWTKAFNYGGGGGYSAPSPFSYGDFNYSWGGAPQVTADTIAGPDKYTSATPFSYGDFHQPTAADMQQDPSYQFRLQQGQKSLENSRAATGLLRSGATAKALQDYGQNAASQEYGNVWNRAMGSYQTNRSNAADIFNTNEGNRFRDWSANTDATYRAAAANASNKLQAGMANAQNSIAGGRLGYDIASGQWDRNYGKARQGYEDQVRDANNSASASSQDYNRSLQQYQMEHDIFQENQSNQWNRLMQMANMGNPGITNPLQYGGMQGDWMTQAANANASGRVGASNAWQNAFSNAANIGAGAAGAWAGYRNPS